MSLQSLAPRGVFLGLVTLMLLGFLWEIVLAPLRPGGSWLALKILPLVLLVPGAMRGARSIRDLDGVVERVVFPMPRGLASGNKAPETGAQRTP